MSRQGRWNFHATALLLAASVSGPGVAGGPSVPSACAGENADAFATRALGSGKKLLDLRPNPRTPHRLLAVVVEPASQEYSVVLIEPDLRVRVLSRDEIAGFAWSPDGGHIALLADADSRVTLDILRADGTPVATREVQSSTDAGIAWLDDHRLVVGRSEDLIRYRVRFRERELLEEATLTLPTEFEYDFSRLSANPRGQLLFVGRRARAEGVLRPPDGNQILLVEGWAAGAAPVPLTLGHEDADPAWIGPDRFLFTRSEANPDRTERGPEDPRTLWLYDLPALRSGRLPVAPEGGMIAPTPDGCGNAGYLWIPPQAQRAEPAKVETWDGFWGAIAGLFSDLDRMIEQSEYRTFALGDPRPLATESLRDWCASETGECHGLDIHLEAASFGRVRHRIRWLTPAEDAEPSRTPWAGACPGGRALSAARCAAPGAGGCEAECAAPVVRADPVPLEILCARPAAGLWIRMAVDDAAGAPPRGPRGNWGSLAGKSTGWFLTTLGAGLASELDADRAAARRITLRAPPDLPAADFHSYRTEGAAVTLIHLTPGQRIAYCAGAPATAAP